MHTSALYRGDVLRALAACGGTVSLETLAKMAGFDYVAPEPEPEAPVMDLASEPEPQGPSPTPVPSPAPRPQLPFWYADSFEKLPQEVIEQRQQVPEQVRQAQAFQPGELKYDHRDTLPGKPLLHWSRLWPFLREVLGRRKQGRQPDLPKVVRWLAQGRALQRLPRKLRRAWHPQVYVLRDRRREMIPFWNDYDYVVKRLEKVRGKGGLHAPEIQDEILNEAPCAPCAEDPQPPSWRRRILRTPDAAVLVLGDLHQLKGGPAQERWLAFGRQLRRRGLVPWALCPCPRERWSARLAHVWNLAAWDRGQRLPQQGGQHPHLSEEEDLASLLLQQRERLYALLAPAICLEPGLLRDLRFLCSHGEADVGTEFDLFNEVGGGALGFSLPLEMLLELRAKLPLLPPALLARVVATIQRHHAYCGHLFGHLEILALDDVLPGVVSQAELEAAWDFLARFSRTAWERPANVDVRSTVEFFAEDLERLQGRAMQAPVLQWAWALAHRGREGALPPGYDPQQTAWTQLAAREPHHRGLFFQEGIHLARHAPGFPLGKLLFPSDHYTLKLLRTPQSDQSEQSFQLGLRKDTVLTAESLNDVTRMSFQSGAEILTLAQTTRPRWASRMWYDRYGLAAEFRIQKVPFVLRWIPPGRFLMGSPADEPGRWEAEGPQHEVVISRGYWLAETVVTQAQWRAVVEAGQADKALWKKFGSKDLKPDPSHFKGSPELPVENVNWLEGRDFCGLLNALIKAPELRFHLPSEAQWEYACRAGTDTALYTGGITIKGENHAPELHDIAWYGGNSGLDLEVTNPDDSSEWPAKQFDHKQAGTHRVKLKQANAWGLHDMLGNVWEWCADPWESDAYGKRDPGVTAAAPDTSDDRAGRVFRGGSWVDLALVCRSAFRPGGDPGDRWRLLGLRLAAGQELGGGAVGRGASSAGEAEPSPEGRRQPRAAAKISS